MPTQIDSLDLGVGGKIVGGTQAAEGRYGFQAAVLHDGIQFCAGSLIAPNIVLTAAHCGSVTVTDVALGCNDISDLSQCDLIPVNSSYIPRFFNNDAFLNRDIQLLTLERDSTEEPITLTAPGFDIADGQDLTVIGWGVTNYATRSDSDKLLEVNLELINQEACDAQYSEIYSFVKGFTYRNIVNDFKMCAIGDEKDVCKGDSGGPIFLRCDATNEDVQVGVVSFGLGCAYEGIPGIYAKVGNQELFDFIDQVVTQEGHSLKTISTFDEFCVDNGTQPPQLLSDPPTPFPTFDFTDWKCSRFYFATGDGCHCECGMPDPDCEFDDNIVVGCASGQICNAKGTCEDSKDFEDGEGSGNFEEGQIFGLVIGVGLVVAVIVAIAAFAVFKSRNSTNLQRQSADVSKSVEDTPVAEHIEKS